MRSAPATSRWFQDHAGNKPRRAALGEGVKKNKCRLPMGNYFGIQALHPSTRYRYDGLQEPPLTPRAESELAMQQLNVSDDPWHGDVVRLVRVIILETLLVAIVGMLVWGVAWEFNYERVGLVAAIVIWLTVSPAVEIATVARFRQSENTRSVESSL